MARTLNVAGADTVLRQWQILTLIPRAPGTITVKEIEARVSVEQPVSRRTIERDLTMLEGRFPLVCDDSVRPQRWSWMDGTAMLSIPALTSAQALTFALVERYLDGLLPSSVGRELMPYFQMAHQRLAGLPVSASNKAWLDKVRVVAAAQALLPPSIDDSVKGAVYEALLHDRKLRVQYQGRDADKPSEYVICPLSLVQRGQLTYLVCALDDSEEPRLFVLHRIREALIEDGGFERLGDFDIDQYIHSGALGFGDGSAISIKLRFTEEAGKHLFDTPLCDNQKIKRDHEGQVIVSATVPETRALYWWLLGFGAQVEVLQPKRLRQQMMETVTAMREVYSL